MGKDEIMNRSQFTIARFDRKQGQRMAAMAAAAMTAMAVLVVGLASPALAGKDDPKAREIMRKVNDRDDGDNQTSDMEMVLIDRKKNKRVRKIRAFNKDKGKDSLALSFFLSPADVKNTGFLTYDYDASGKDDDQWLYLPALRKTKRIASDDKSGSFMGSDFNYSDMTEPDLEDYDYTLMKEVKVGGHMTWQIQSVPRSKAIAEETGYKKSILWVRQDIYMTVRGIRWVNKSNKLKYLQFKKIKKIEGIWVATQLQAVTKEGKHTSHASIVNISNIKFNQPLKESFFTVRQLEKGP